MHVITMISSLNIKLLIASVILAISSLIVFVRVKLTISGG